MTDFMSYPRGKIKSGTPMQDLTNWLGRPAPAPVSMTGRYVMIEPFVRAIHERLLWDALGGTAINELLRFFSNGPYERASDLSAWIETSNAGSGWTTLVFRARRTGDIVGMATYMRPDPANGVIEVGSVAHGAAMARSPLATEAQYLMARHVFDDLGYRRYEWKCHDLNLASKAAAVRLGFTFEGVFRQHIVAKGMNRDTAWFSMIDSEWPSRAKAFEAWLAASNFDADGLQKRRLEDIREELT